MRRAPFHSWRLLAGRVAALFAGAILFCFLEANGETVTEPIAKIRFMHYVAQYAVWPKDVLSPQDRQFVLGVLGENPFGGALENYFKGKSVKGREFVIKFYKTVEEAKECQMLFISSSEKSNFAQILSELEDTSILTLSDAEGFIQKNGMVFMFITKKSEITGGLGWDINGLAMKKARLQIDPFFIEKARKPNQ
jgi:hypothetical protein